MSYKANLSANNLSLSDKAKAQMRRPTPDSDVLASSDDEHVPTATRPLPANTMAAGRRPSSGWLQDIQPNRKFSLPSVSFAGSQPTTPSAELPSQTRTGTAPSFPWNTSSFTSNQAGTRLKEVLPSPTSVHPPQDKTFTSPTNEGDDGIGFLLQQNPIRKSVRSQSYSVGQGNDDPASQFSNRLRTSLRHRPSKPSLLGESLSQLREDDLDEVESSNGSEGGLRLPPGYWEREQQKQAEHALLKQAANARARNRAPSTSSPTPQHRRKTVQGLRGMSRADSDFAIEELDDGHSAIEATKTPLTRRYSEHVGALSHDIGHEELADSNALPSWAGPNSTLGMVIESLGRRHSFATYGTHSTTFQASTLSNTYEEDEEAAPGSSARDPSQLDQTGIVPRSRHDQDQLRAQNIAEVNTAYCASYNPQSYTQAVDQTLTPTDTFDPREFALSFPHYHQSQWFEDHRADFVATAEAYFTGYGPASRAINASSISAAHPNPASHLAAHSTNTQPYTVPGSYGRPARRLFIVTFKCSRADIYYLYANTGLEIRRGDLVITEGDRGTDLGQVTHADISMEEAKKLKAEANEEHFRWLVMFSQYSLAGTATDSGMLGALARAKNFAATFDRNAVSSMGAPANDDAKPRMIKRLAQAHEIYQLRDKEGNEAKAKRLGAQKAVEHKLPMEILDAEFQADFNKLTFFYYAEQYVNFNPLVTDVFKAYKIRIWMSAVNPASVVNPAGLMSIPPPSAIGPGAILPSSRPTNAAPIGPGFGGDSGYRGGQGGQYGGGYYGYGPQVPVYAASQQTSYYDPAFVAAFQGMRF